MNRVQEAWRIENETRLLRALETGVTTYGGFYSTPNKSYLLREKFFAIKEERNYYRIERCYVKIQKAILEMFFTKEKHEYWKEMDGIEYEKTSWYLNYRNLEHFFKTSTEYYEWNNSMRPIKVKLQN